MSDSPDDADGELITEQITASGHENVSGTHESTFEITSEEFLTPAGDCILAIDADSVPAEFSPAFVEACQRQSVSITITLKAGGQTDTIVALGSPDLTFESDRSAVIRTSDYIDDRTVGIAASKAAGDIDRQLVDALARGADLTVTFAVEGN